MTDTAIEIPPAPECPAWIARTAIDWNPMTTPYDYQLVLKAEGYQKWIDAFWPDTTALAPCDFQAGGSDHTVIGNYWLFRRRFTQYVWTEPGIFTLRRNPSWELHGLNLYKGGKPYGRVYFHGEVLMPVLCDHQYRPWMSPTPSEILTQRPGLRKAHGRVLVGGLGMGWAAQMIRERKEVRHVTIAERDDAIVEYFGKGIQQKPGACFQILREDFYEYAENNLALFDSIIADIWPEYQDASYDRRWQKLKEKFKKVNPKGKIWGWGDYAVD